MSSYLIKIWETEELRDSGESDIIEVDIKSLKKAIDKAKEMMEKQQYASLEVQNREETKTFYYSTPKEEEYVYRDILREDNISQRIKTTVELYFIENNIIDLMDYGADRDSLAMPSLSELYKDILQKLNIKFNSIETDEISDGKYKTFVEFANETKIRIDTSAFNGMEIVADNIEDVLEEYENMQTIMEDNDMEM